MVLGSWKGYMIDGGRERQRVGVGVNNNDNNKKIGFLRTLVALHQGQLELIGSLGPWCGRIRYQQWGNGEIVDGLI